MVLADHLVVVPDDTTTDIRPAAPEVLRRTLLDRLTSSRATVVVLCGQAGAGKSTLLRQWEQADDRRFVALDLTVRHDSPAVLAEALVSSLAAVGPSEPDALAAITDEEPSFSSVVVPGLAEVAATRSRPYLLAVDDLHLLRDQRAEALLRSLAEGVPDGSALVLATRGAPPAWVVRMRAAGAALVVAPRDLAFDAAEASALTAAFGLPASDAGVLLRETEGWAVTLHLAALARTSDRTGSTAYDESTVAVTDYLRSEVLDRLPADQRDLLVRTSIVEAPTAGLCDALVGRDDSAVLLRDAVRRTSLVRERDGVFRPHHLLLDALRAELTDTVGAGEIAELHRRAGRWFLDHGDPESAVDHALAAGDAETVATVVGAAIPESAGSGRSDRLARLLARIGDDRVASDRWLCVAAAWSSLQRGDVDDRDRWTLLAESHAGQDWRSQVRTDPYAASLAALLAIVGRDGVAATARLCEDALEGLGPTDPFRCPTFFLLGVSRILLGEPGGEEAIAESRRSARLLHVPVNEADALAFSGLVSIWRGDVSSALRVIDQAAAIVAEVRAERLATAAHPLTAYAVSLALQGRRPEAARALAQARRLTYQVRGIVPWFHVLGPVIQARAALLLDDVPLAAQLLSEARAAWTSDLDSTLLGEVVDDVEQLIREQVTTATGAGTLTPAELRVLAYLPSHLTFPQIGEQLFLSASTVKTHALAIYRKLGVASRDEAVSTARRLGLVEAALRG